MDTPNDLLTEEKRREVYENQDWAKLSPDLLRKILESLSSIDFYRAKTVCSDWYTVWKTCLKPLYPWHIIYQDDSLMLFDPREDKLYTTKVIGLSDDSYFMASSGNWLLIVDSCLDFYIFNLVTRERINLPSMESSIHRSKSSLGDGHTVRFERSDNREYGEWGHFVEYGHLEEPCRKDHVSEDIVGCKRSAVLWIDERTGDYVVAWIFNKHYLFTYKNGDDSWRNWNSNWKSKRTNLGYLDLAYLNNKLYLYTTNDYIKIIDFSGDFPKEEIGNNPYQDLPFHYVPQECEDYWKTRIALQKSGEVLIILSLFEFLHEERCLFYIFKMNFESGEWERVDSIGDDEMLIFGHGVTIRAPVQDVGDGIKNGSICFVKDDLWPGYKSPSYCGVFDLATSRINWSKKFCFDITKSQWFAPGFA
ncbi:putative F-box protein [Cardamine amara subsp. amara]|uniref:F-box protein n=1 Tax=Cardamine amara subsp. amara TaxID=228776 RepID=A0ABD1BCJ1_CARAN